MLSPYLPENGKRKRESKREREEKERWERERDRDPAKSRDYKDTSSVCWCESVIGSSSAVGVAFNILSYQFIKSSDLNELLLFQ
jgi:hypothetical protein